MSPRSHTHCIELLCRQAEAPTFARLGFQTMATAEPANAPATVRMTHPVVNDAIVTSLVDLRLNGRLFTARIVEMNCELTVQEVML